MRWQALTIALLATSCTPAWEIHTTRLGEAEHQQDIETALSEERWLIDHAFTQAPPDEQGRAAEAKRYLDLARLAAKVGDLGEAVTALRVALRTDPAQHPAILHQLAELPLAVPERRQLDAEFRWNVRVLIPDATIPEETALPCWSYRAREVRVRHHEIHQGLGVGERRLSYDGRSWAFDADRDSWRADGEWVADIGAETEKIDGPPRPRYQAIAAADGGFFADGPVPPCHRSGWTGPFDTQHDRLFVAGRLPGTIGSP